MLEDGSVIPAIIEKRKALSPQHALLVGISGIDASGKGFVTTRIAESLQKRGIKLAVISADGWLNLPHVRFHQQDLAKHFNQQGWDTNRGFQFQKRRQLLIGLHNETLSVVAMRICNKDRSPVGIDR